MAARPFLVGVTDLVRRPGERKPVRRAAPLDLAISTAAVEPGADVVADLELEAIAHGVVATGTVQVPWVGDCRRCLEPVHGTTATDVREIFERRPVEGETYPLVDDVVDLEPMLRDAVLLTLPLAPLCAEACRGPEPDQFPATVEGEGEGEDAGGGEAAEPPADPRWAALDQLRFD